MVETLARPSEKAAERSVTEVEKFITRLWEHPLLDTKTRQFRQAAREQFVRTATSFTISPEEYIGIPIGSFHWITTDRSDYDYLIIHPQNTETFFSNIGHAFNYTIDSIEIHGIATAEEALKAPTGAVSSQLLLTPDEYLVGDLYIAQQLRLQLIQEIAGKGNTDSAWDNVGSRMRTVLHEYYTDWPQSASKRTQRYIENLNTRAGQTRNPSSWIDGFEKAKKTLELPSFETYSDALTQTGGVLRINPRFIATGISK